MERFNYASYLYNQKILDIETKEDREHFKKIIDDIKRLEEYFSKMIPNIEIIKPIIAFSYKLNKEIQWEDRINYIRGIIYSRRYIDMEDVHMFADYLSQDLDPEDSNSIFFNKGFSDNKYGFFTDAFDEDFVTYVELSEVYKNEKLVIDENGNIVDSESGNRVIIQPDINNNDIDDCSENSELQEEEENIDKDEENESIYYDYYYSVTPEEKLKLFKENFEMFVVEMIKRKNLDKEDEKTRGYIILGMRDWYEYVMNMLDGAYEVNKAQKLYNSIDLTKFI